MAVAALAPLLIKFGGDLVERLFPDKTQQAEQRAAALQHVQDLAAQADTLNVQTLQSVDVEHTKVLQAEASSSQLFVSGWYAFIGWVCGVALAYHFLLRPLIQSLINLWRPAYVMVSLDWTQLSAVLVAMIGAGAGHYINVKGASSSG